MGLNREKNSPKGAIQIIPDTFLELFLPPPPRLAIFPLKNKTNTRENITSEKNNFGGHNNLD